jgi:predicted ester cyclase
MSREDVEKVAEAYMSDGPLALAEDVVFTLADSGEAYEGRDAVSQLLSAWYGEMFEADSERLAMYVGDDAFAVEFRFEGTHIGDFYGIGATGRSVSFPFVGVYQVEGSEIVGGRIYMPMERIKSLLS